MSKEDIDLEAASGPRRISHSKLVFDQGVLTPEIISWKYKGQGTQSKPYIVEWINDDPRDPLGWSKVKKWTIAFTVTFATLAVSFDSSAYSGGMLRLCSTHMPWIALTFAQEYFSL